MSFLAALIVETLVIVVAIPAAALGLGIAVGGRPAWMRERAQRRPEPGIQTFLMLCLLTVVAVGLMFIVPFVGAWGSQEHRFTALIGLFLGVLALLGVAYAWRRGVLRWD